MAVVDVLLIQVIHILMISTDNVVTLVLSKNLQVYVKMEGKYIFVSLVSHAKVLFVDLLERMYY